MKPTLSFMQLRLVLGIVTGETPKITMSHFNQLLDMFETLEQPTLAGLYAPAMSSAYSTLDPGLRVIYQANVRRFFTDLADFADKHGRLDRLIFGLSEAINIATE